MSKSFRDSGRSERFVKGGGAGRGPHREAVRPTPSFLGMLFGSSTPKPPSNIGSRRPGTSPPKRGHGTTKDNGKPNTSKSKWF